MPPSRLAPPLALPVPLRAKYIEVMRLRRTERQRAKALRKVDDTDVDLGMDR